MNMNKFENAPDAVTIKEAALILEIHAEWVVAKIEEP